VVILHAAIIVAVTITPVPGAAPAPPGAPVAVGAAAIASIAIWTIVGPVVGSIMAVIGIAADLDAKAGTIIPEIQMYSAPGFHGC
jgi:hypothetical protein